MPRLPEPPRAAAPGTPPAVPAPVRWTAAALLALGLAHLAVFAVDGGPWYGPVSWRKPVTFGVSFGLTLAAVAWVTSYVRTGARTRAVLLGVLAADSVVEVAGITVQAWRHVPSHLDMETPLDTSVSAVLAAGGAVLVAVLAAFAAAAFRRPPGGPAGMAAAVRAGFALLLVGLAAGAAMIARGIFLVRTGHQVAAYASTAPLKPLHAVCLHAVLVLPALAWAASRTRWGATARRRLVAAAAGCYAVAALAAGLWPLLAA